MMIKVRPRVEISEPGDETSLGTLPHFILYTQHIPDSYREEIAIVPLPQQSLIHYLCDWNMD